jgi:hypothetical protein
LAFVLSWDGCVTKKQHYGTDSLVVSRLSRVIWHPFAPRRCGFAAAWIVAGFEGVSHEKKSKKH